MEMNRRTIAKLLAMMMFIAPVSGCSGSDTARWTEEVKSSDGTVFQLEGRAEIGANGWPTQHRGNLHYIEYYHRPTKAYWHSPGGYEPWVFDLVDGVPYVVVAIENSTLCYLLNYPEKGLLIFRWNTTTGWQPVKVEEMPPKLEINLMQQVFDTRDKRGDVQGFISLGSKVAREGSRVGELAKWIKEYGDFCEKSRKIGRVKTNAIAPNFIGFHGKPDF